MIKRMTTLFALVIGIAIGFSFGFSVTSDRQPVFAKATNDNIQELAKTTQKHGRDITELQRQIKALKRDTANLTKKVNSNRHTMTKIKTKTGIRLDIQDEN